MKLTKKWAIVLLYFSSIGLQAAKVDTLQVMSPSMNTNIEVVVISPDKSHAQACPVLYLLHGHGGNAKTWMNIKPELPQIADEKEIIIVCPDGKNSWYWDSPINKNMCYETFISKELIAFVDSNYNAIPRREGRAITGLSMGGHGAMWNAIRHSDVFSAAGSTSGGVDIRPFPKNWNMNEQLGDKEMNPQNWETHTVINLVPTLKSEQLVMIVDCGIDDFFLDVNKAFHEALLKQGIEHDFILRPGVHNNTYWNNAIDYQILFFQKHFKQHLK